MLYSSHRYMGQGDASPCQYGYKTIQDSEHCPCSLHVCGLHVVRTKWGWGQDPWLAGLMHLQGFDRW